MLVFSETEEGDYTVVEAVIGSLRQRISEGHSGFTPMVEDILSAYKIPYERKVYTQEEFEEKF